MGFYFDTVVTIVLYGAPEGLLDEIWADCARYEQLLSKTIQGSDVDRINHAGGQPVQVDHETWEILRRAIEVSDSSGHAFSVTIAPLTALWDFTGGTNRMPTDEERLAALLSQREEPRPSLVLNRVRPLWVRRGLVAPPDQIALALDMPLMGVIPESTKIYKALLRHETALDCGDKKVAAAVEVIAARLLGADAPLPEYAPSPMLRFFNRGGEA